MSGKFGNLIGAIDEGAGFKNSKNLYFVQMTFFFAQERVRLDL
jgi:hypothetical protein